MTSASRVMKTRRTLNQFLRAEGAAFSSVAAAKLSGKTAELDFAGFGGSVADVFAAVLLASSSCFSIRTRMSAPRLVSTGGGPGLGSMIFAEARSEAGG